MTTIVELTKSEWTKIMAKGKYKVLMILIGLFAIGACLVYFVLQSHLNLTLMEGELFPIWVLNRLMTFILPLLTLLIVGDTISGEFQDGTIKNVLSLPVSRTAIYISKLLAIGFYLLLMLGVVAAISFVGALIVSGFSVVSGFGNLLIAYLGAFIVLGLIMVLSSFVSLFISSSSFALVINLLLWFSMSTLGLFVPTLASYLPTSYTHWYEPLIMSGNLQQVIPMLLYMISYYIILTIIGTWKFQKREG